jgi:site-specific recombinase XerD
VAIELIQTFSSFLKAEGKSKNTISSYIIGVRQFLRAHKNNINSITQGSIDDFFSGFNSRRQTQNSKKMAVTKFLQFLYDRKQIKKLFAIHCKNIVLPEPEYLSPAEQDRFFEVLQADLARNRDFILFSTMLYTGMRISEVLNLRYNDIQDDHLVIRESKTGAGKVYVRKKLQTLLKSHVEAQKQRSGAISNDYLFLSKQKTRLTERMVELLIKKYLRIAGIRKDLTPHSLRHTFAARLRQSGSDLEIVQRTLRHKHIQSTMRYSHIKDTEVVNAIEKSMKVAKLNK